MKITFLILIFLPFLVSFSMAQGTFFNQGSNENEFSIFHGANEKNSVYYLCGGYSNFQPDSFSSIYLAKMSSYGNIFHEYVSHESNLDQQVYDVSFPNDTTIRLFVACTGITESKLKIQDLDTNLTLRNEVVFKFKDSIYVNIFDHVLDDEGNYYITGHLSTHPYYYFAYDKEFIFKISSQLDSLKFIETTGKYIINISFNSYNSMLYTTGDIYDMGIYNKNLDLVKIVRVDTVTADIKSHLQMETNKYAVSGTQTDFLNGSNHRYIILRTVDTLGLGIDYAEIDAPDTISTTQFGSLITYNVDSSALYFSWKKNDEFFSFCNNGEPSFIGVGMFDLNLNPIWISYFTDGLSDFKIIDQITTSDGGLLVTGSFMKCVLYDLQSHYFVLKVDSSGNYTYLKEIETPRVMMKVFPNPATDYLRVELEDQDAQIECIRIIAMDGKEMRNINSTSNHELINLQDLPCGTYTIEIKDGKGRMIYSKFVKQ